MEVSKAKYYAYRNLHTGGFSIKNKGKVIERPFMFIMVDAEFRVSQAGRKRAIDQQQRNVHAYVVADYVESYDFDDDRVISIGVNIFNNKLFTEVTYNPFHLDSFVTADKKIPVEKSEFIVALQDKVYMRTCDIIK